MTSANLTRQLTHSLNPTPLPLSPQVLTEDRGFKLSFHFKENPYFSNTVLEKTFLLEEEDEFVPRQFIGCKIDWKKAEMDTTMEAVKKRVPPSKAGGDKKKKVFETVLEPCDSFFRMFSPPNVSGKGCTEGCTSFALRAGLRAPLSYRNELR